MDKSEEYYNLMLNALSGLEDDLVANEVPAEALYHLRKSIEICSQDFRAKFTEKKPDLGG